MIGALRRSRLLLITAVIALLTAVPMTTLPLLHGGDDPGCDISALNGSSHERLNDGRATATGEQHCVTCHWLRWARAIEDDAPAVTPSVESLPVSVIGVTRPRSAAASLSFARAPPRA